MITFKEYCEVVDILAFHEKLNPIRPIKPQHAPKPITGQPTAPVPLPDSWTLLARLGIPLFDPSQEDIERWVNRMKGGVITQPPQVPNLEIRP